MDLDAILRKFWWIPRTEGNSFFTPIAWSSLCKPFSDGGLGFRKFERFNEAMLSKLAWWILSNRDNFCVKVLRGKYKVRFNWLSCSPTKSSSFAWKGIESTWSLLAKGSCRLVGNGVNMLVYEDPWIPDLPGFVPLPRSSNDPPFSLVVAQLMDDGRNGWNMDKLSLYFDDNTVAAILNIPSNNWDIQDSWIWLHDPNGQLIVKSTFKELNNNYGQVSSPVLGKIWKLSLHERLKTHLCVLLLIFFPLK